MSIAYNVESLTVSGIYGISEIATGLTYVGSARNAWKRWNEHRGLLNRGKHPSPRLQNLWTKRGGETAFRFHLLETCPDEPLILITREQAWIDRHKKQDMLLNTRSAAKQFSSEWNRTDEAKIVHAEHAKKMADWWKTRKSIIKLCALCGTEFETRSTNHSARFCSHRCSCNSRKGRTNERKPRSSKLFDRTCIHCGKTYQSNVYSKSRFCSASCQNHERSNLNENDIVPIIERAVSGERITDIGRSLNVSHLVILKIVQRQSWVNIPIPSDLQVALQKYWSSDEVSVRQRKADLDDDNIRDIRRRAMLGENQSAIARDYGVSQTTVSDIKRGKYKRYAEITAIEFGSTRFLPGFD